MSGPDWILERERRRAQQILELDMEELQVEEVDDADSSSSSDVDTFLRLYLENFAGVVLFPEAALSLRVIQTRLVEAIDKAVSHVDAPCMIGVVHVYQHTNNSHHTIASVGTMAKIRDIQLLDDGSSCVLTCGQQRFLLRRRWLDADGIPWGEVQIIEEDTPLRTPRDAFAQLAASNNFRQCVPPIPSLHASCFKQLDDADSEPDWDSPSPTSTSSDHSVSDKRIHISDSQSSGSLRCSILDEFTSEDEDPMHEESWGNQGSVNKNGSFGHSVKHKISGDEVDLCLTSSKSISRTLIARRSDMVMVSSDGPVGTYMKLRDHGNEMITVYNVIGLALRGDPSKAYSLFPGYTWTIALCSSCESIIGWLFTADKKNLHPKSFWAIRTSQISDDTQSRQVCRRSR
ncbi:hypothetical protein PR202_gb04796 [Eleusine coracana subsp. coracana]|uniref:CULT domain-containing protein n=1 Tax=Eleusine coracana subsp. coracana TaxID=191504 RepID=A0AAV5E4Z9_ELECO|nr:hypothetical protein PR202_gb04796 [Eleusine coracana subsp. coracana]